MITYFRDYVLGVVVDTILMKFVKNLEFHQGQDEDALEEIIDLDDIYVQIHVNGG